MKTKFNFKSQICTTREQSERLLSLGLKKETADCAHVYGRPEHELYEDWETVILDDSWEPYWDVTDEDIPAWSLHRLLKIVQPMMENQNEVTIPFDNVFEQIIDCIEWLIKEGYFNKEYLCEK